MSKEEIEVMMRIIKLVKSGKDVELSRTSDGAIKAYIIRKNKVAV